MGHAHRVRSDRRIFAESCRKRYASLGKRFGDSGYDEILALTRDRQNIVATGIFQSQVDFGVNPLVQSNGATDFFVMKLASSGLVPTWAKGFGGAANDASASVAVATNGEIAVTGDLSGDANFGGGALATSVRRTDFCCGSRLPVRTSARGTGVVSEPSSA